MSVFLDQCDGQFKMTEAEAIKSLGKGPDDEYAAFTAAGASKSQDNGVGIANAAGIPVCASIRQALCIGDGKKLNVDGVVLIGEHGDYPADEFGRHMYPRKHLFEQIAGVFAASGKSVPVFNDKHFSYNMEDGALCTAQPLQNRNICAREVTMVVCWSHRIVDVESRERARHPAVCRVIVGSLLPCAFSFHF